MRILPAIFLIVLIGGLPVVVLLRVEKLMADVYICPKHGESEPCEQCGTETTDNQPALQPPELKPCPFCGVVPTTQSHTQEDEMDEGRYLFFIECGNSACPMALVSTGGPFKDENKAANRWNTRTRVAGGVATVDYGSLHWQLKAGAEETMCGRLAQGVRCTLLQDFATCKTCKAVAFGYQMGRADERATTAPVAASVDDRKD